MVAKSGFWRHNNCMQCKTEACDGRSYCDPRGCEVCGAAPVELEVLLGGVELDEADEEGGEAGGARVRAVVLGCPPGVCEAGHCVRGNEGPVCGR